jgi:hypothetical protein
VRGAENWIFFVETKVVEHSKILGFAYGTLPLPVARIRDQARTKFGGPRCQNTRLGSGCRVFHAEYESIYGSGRFVPDLGLGMG